MRPPCDEGENLAKRNQSLGIRSSQYRSPSVMLVSQWNCMIPAEVPVANQDVKVDEPNQLQDPADEGVANDEGPDAEDLPEDESVIEEPEDAEHEEKEEELALP